MFWVHNKFGNGLDDPDGPSWPDYPTKLVLLDDPNGSGRSKNPDRLDWPDDPNKPDSPACHGCEVEWEQFQIPPFLGYLNFF